MRIAYLEGLLQKHGIQETPNCYEPLTFTKFSKHFLPDELAVLRSIDHDRRKDTTFVRNCLNYMYKDKLYVFKKKSALGAPKRNVNSSNGTVVEVPATEAITPEKYVILKEIFSDRISAMTISEDERDERKRKLNNLIGKAITNIRTNLLKNEATLSVSY